MKSRVSSGPENLTSSGLTLRGRISTMETLQQKPLDLTEAGWFIRKNISSLRTILRLLSAQMKMAQNLMVLFLFMTG
jgi:hypothetical protein